MSEKKYSLHEVTESLRISPDTLYRWETQIPDLKPLQHDRGRLYTSWEFDLLQHAHRLFHNYNQDFAGTRSALERWISKNPRPHAADQASDDEIESKEPLNSSGAMRALSIIDEEISLDSASPARDRSSFAPSVNQRSVTAPPNQPISAPPPENFAQEEIIKPSASNNIHQDIEHKGDEHKGDEHKGDEHKGDEHKGDEYKRDEESSLHLEDPFASESEGNRHEHLAVMKQSGGKRRVIGRTDEDLFADLDADPFDLSPSPHDHFRSLSLTNHSPKAHLSADDKVDQLAPSIVQLEKSFSRSTPAVNQQQVQRDGATMEETSSKALRSNKPSSSDWLEGSTATHFRAEDHSQVEIADHQRPSAPITQSVPNTDFKPTRAFTNPQIEVYSPTSVDTPSLAPVARHYQQAEDQEALPAHLNPAQLKPIPVKRSSPSPLPISGDRSSNISTPYGSTKISSSTYLNQKWGRPVDTQSDAFTSTPQEREPQTNYMSTNDRLTGTSAPPVNAKDQESWQRAYHHSQAQLARAKGDLARTQDTNTKQRKEIKILQAQLLSIKESILKEIYDLRDLVVDK